ncbi:VOC family protein [Leifsonia sp. RAF41]|uniref:VOC family protein n=1 Tax=Leifsonia sp. RAF41 TaxID=3233056 RepID=UPI003F96B233
MTRVFPYLNFRGDAREAMLFYREVFGGELTLNTAEDLGLAIGDHRGSQVMHAQLITSDGMVLSGGDIHADDPDEPDVGNVCTIMVSGEQDPVERIWRMLSSGGRIDVPWGQAPWGDLFGSCVDRFGIPWLVNVG